MLISKLVYSTFSESFVEECSFESALGLCPRWNTGGTWKFSSRKKLSGHNGINLHFSFAPHAL